MSIDNEARVIHDELIHLVNPPHIQESVTREAMELARIEYEKFNGHDDHPQQENDSKPNRNIQIVSWDSIQIKKVLGTGGFAVVILAKVPELVAPKQQHSHDVLKRWNHSNTASTSNTTAPKTNGLFAIKCMNKESAYNPTQFIRAARDLFNEAILLSMLQHPNIIQLDGVSSLLYGDEEDDGKVRRTSSKKVNDGVSSSRMTITSSSIFQQPGGYFLVLQQLKGTLYEKLRCWRQMPSNTQPCIHYRLSKFALKISEAMEYIHSHQIIYRDLKPQNVGIDCDGNVRLFDFGLARKLRDGESSISGCTGSLRYMAPEVFDLKEASRSSDIFSFGIVLWEILALARPYHHREVGPGRHRRQSENEILSNTQEYILAVGQSNIRPSPLPNVSIGIKSLIQACWDKDPKKRPHFDIVLARLHNEIDPSWESTLCQNNDHVSHRRLQLNHVNLGDILKQIVLGRNKRRYRVMSTKHKRRR